MNATLSARFKSLCLCSQTESGCFCAKNGLSEPISLSLARRNSARQREREREREIERKTVGGSL